MKFFKMMCACVCAHVCNCSLAGAPSALRGIQGPCKLCWCSFTLPKATSFRETDFHRKEWAVHSAQPVFTPTLYTKVCAEKGTLDPVRQFTPVTEVLMSMSENRNRQVPDVIQVSLGLMRAQWKTQKCASVGERTCGGHDAKLHL